MQPIDATSSPHRWRLARHVMRVAGLDLAAGRGRTAVAVFELRPRDDPLPQWRRTSTLPLVSDADIVGVLAAQQPTVLAIDAPLSLPARVAAALGLAVATDSDPSNGEGSPYTRAAERDPVWHALGVRPLPVSFLGGLTFRALAILPLLRATLPAVQVIEAFPSGTLAALGIQPPLVEGRHAAKTTAHRRASVQQALLAHIHGVPAPATELLDADSLDALACALTATAFARGTYRCAGNASEGQIILPAIRSVPAES